MIVTRLRMAAFALLAIGVCCAGVAAKESDAEKLVGTWVAESGEQGGEKAPEDKIKGLELTFAADGKVTLKSPKEPGKQKEATFKLDGAKNPKEIDLTPEGDEPVRGIYKIEGNKLTLCMAHKQDPRPTEFASQAGTKQVLIVLKREKK